MSIKKLQRYVNFDAGDEFSTRTQTVHIYEHKSTGTKDQIVSFHPDIKTMAPQELVTLLEHLQWHFQYLERAKPTDDRVEMRPIWKECKAQTQWLISCVRNQIEDYVNKTREENCGHMYYYESNNIFALDELRDACPYIGLETAEDFILYQYANGAFPQNMDQGDKQMVRQELEEQLDKLLEMEDKSAYEFWSFRCQQKKAQIEQLCSAMPNTEQKTTDTTKEEKTMEKYIFVPELARRIAANQISLLEELELFLQRLEEEKPECDTSEEYHAWNLRREQVQTLEQQTKGQLKAYLDEIWDRLPGIGLQNEQDYVIYWYVEGCFPEDMEYCEIEKVERELRDRLDWLSEDLPLKIEPWEYRLWKYRQKLLTDQLDELALLKRQNDRDDWDDWDDWDGVRMNENADEDEEGSPVFMFWVPDEPEDPESLTMEELIAQIEKQQFILLGLKEVEFGAEGIDRPFNWQEGVDRVNALLEKLHGLLEQRMTEVQGVRIHADMGDKETPEEIIAGWYLNECFPSDLNAEEMMQVERKLREQLTALEDEESEYEEADNLELWKYRRDLKANLIDDIQTMMWHYDLNGEEWTLEEGVTCE